MPYRIGEVAERANVPEDFVRQLIDLGALPGEEAGLGIPEVRRSRLLHSWAAAGSRSRRSWRWSTGEQP